MSDIEKLEEGSEEVSETSVVNLGSTKYRNSKSSAEDNRSSGWVLISIGAIGIIAIVLSIARVIPFRFGNPYLTYGVMSAVFVLFFVMGFVSLANAKKYESKAKGEESVRDSILKWVDKNLTAEDIDKEIPNADTETEEVLYFKRAIIISMKLNRQFINLDPSYTESLIDEVIYSKLFGEAEEYQEDYEDDDYDDDDSDEEDSDEEDSEDEDSDEESDN